MSKCSATLLSGRGGLDGSRSSANQFEARRLVGLVITKSSPMPPNHCASQCNQVPPAYCRGIVLCVPKLVAVSWTVVRWAPCTVLQRPVFPAPFLQEDQQFKDSPVLDWNVRAPLQGPSWLSNCHLAGDKLAQSCWCDTPFSPSFSRNAVHQALLHKLAQHLASEHMEQTLSFVNLDFYKDV